MASSPRRSALVILAVILACGCVGMLFGQRLNTSATPPDSDIRESVRSFTQVYEVVQQNYAETVNPDKAIYNGAIPGMLRVLDPHSNFFDPKAYAALREDQRGKYYGVGMQVGPRNNKVIVIAPFTGAPAYRAGIRPGDVIIAVDGKPTDNMSTSDVADLLKGPKGTTVKITVLREGTDKPIEFNVGRDEKADRRRGGGRRDSAVQRRCAFHDSSGHWIHPRQRLPGNDGARSSAGARPVAAAGRVEGADPRPAAEPRRTAQRRRGRGR